MKIVLASESPRRIRLLKKILKSFSVVPSGLDENQFLEKDPLSYALKAAEAKAQAVGENYPEALVIAADTVVTVDGLILGKPGQRAEARRMLEVLSGRTHQVITAVAVCQKQEEKFLSDFETSLVTFKPLTPEEIDSYLDRNTYQDKAGAYAIQEIKSSFLKKLEGDYNNVVGLPVRRLGQLLSRFLERKTELEITAFVFPEGLGLGQSQGRTFQVAGTYPGDLVEISYELSEDQTVPGKLISIISPSPQRQQPVCPHFGLCGGCSFQDLSYSEQLRQKSQYLLQVFKEYFPSSYRYLEIDDVLPSPSLYFYRNKMEFSFGQSGNEIFLGLKEKTGGGSGHKNKKVVRLAECHLCTPQTEKIFSFFPELCRKPGLPVFSLKSKLGFFRHLVIREGKKTGELMLLLVTTSEAELETENFTEQLLQALPELRGFWWVENNRIADVVSFEKSHHLYGQEAIEEQLLGFRFKIYPASFFQTNPLAAEIVYTRIVEEARRLRTQSALGLYCGSGAIEICLSKVAGEVVGVDWDAANIKTANENVKINNLKNVSFWESPVEEVLPEIYRGSFDLLVIDPPRAGISPKGIKQIVSLKIPNIIYVSCNPNSLARDLKILSDSSYQVSGLTPVDFFPHTAHLEVVAFLNR
jgi:23S rRNA (uracil-5-)-methyltransferase RumA/MAF protein